MSGRVPGIRVELDKRATAAIMKALEPAVKDATEFLLDEANTTIPFEQGIMDGTGEVSVDSGADHVTGQVSYNTKYARRQHEDTRNRHDPGRRAKWLQRTFEEQAPRIGNFLAEHIRKALP